MRILRALAAAWTLLTIVPLPARWTRNLTVSDWARSAAAFPFVGAIVGGLAACTACAATSASGPWIGAVVGVIASLLLTGGVHLDGLADSADALGARGQGEQQRRRRLEIMHDSATGAYGTIALIAVLLLQTAALASLAVNGIPTLAAAMIAAAVFARAAGVAHAYLLPPARANGLGAAFEITTLRFLAMLMFTGALIAAGSIVWTARGLDPPTSDWSVAGLTGAMVAAFLTTERAHRTLDGRTGDTIGATIALAETFALVALHATL